MTLTSMVYCIQKYKSEHNKPNELLIPSTNKSQSPLPRNWHVKNYHLPEQFTLSLPFFKFASSATGRFEMTFKFRFAQLAGDHTCMLKLQSNAKYIRFEPIIVQQGKISMQ